MKSLPLLLIISFFSIIGCTSSPESIQLDEIDSLVKVEEYDSAYHEILRMNNRFDRPEDKAHYQLLLVQTSYLTYNTLASDSTIDSAITYFEKDGDLQKLTDAYYYKAASSHERKDYTQAINFYKKAEEVAQKTRDLRLKYKIAESIIRINNQNGNYSLQLNYAKKALDYALEAGNKNWIAYSYFNLSRAYQAVGNVDSLSIYAKELITRLDDIYPQDLPAFKACIGYMYYKKGEWELAKKYYEESLEHQETAHTLVNLADVYVKEGNEEEAYKLWKRAFLLNDGNVKDVILFNMLQHDLDHNHELEDACERLYEVYAAKDSMTNALKDRTILELQQKHDEEALSLLHEKKRMRWIIATLILALATIVLAGYAAYRRNKTQAMMTRHQMLIDRYNTEIHQLKKQCQIAEQSTQKNIELEAICQDAERKIDELNRKIAHIVEKASPILNRGKVLYDDIAQNKSTISWSKNDYKCFVEYYKALHLMEYEAMTKPYHHITYHNALFLILREMGKKNKEIGEIMGISQDSVRSIQFRMKKKGRT